MIQMLWLMVFPPCPLRVESNPVLRRSAVIWTIPDLFPLDFVRLVGPTPDGRRILENEKRAQLFMS